MTEVMIYLNHQRNKCVSFNNHHLFPPFLFCCRQPLAVPMRVHLPLYPDLWNTNQVASPQELNYAPLSLDRTNKVLLKSVLKQHGLFLDFKFNGQNPSLCLTSPSLLSLLVCSLSRLQPPSQSLHNRLTPKPHQHSSSFSRSESFLPTHLLPSLAYQTI